MLLILFISLFHFEQADLWQTLQKETLFVEEGDTENLRTSFVGFQGEMEENLVRLLEKEEVSYLHCVIHTMTPPTPLCTSLEAVGVHPTIAKRAITVRRLLEAGAYLTGAFPEEGLQKRKREEIGLYKEEKAQHSRYKELFLSDFQEKDSGATYFIQAKDGQEWIFAINFFQINTEQKICQAALLFGTRDDPKIKEHLNKPFLLTGS